MTESCNRPNSDAPSLCLGGISVSATTALKLFDSCLIALLLVSPLFLGGRHPIGELVLVSFIGLASMLWVVRQCFSQSNFWRRTKAEWLLLAAGAVVVLQLLPLPRELLTRLSPRLSETLPLWFGSPGATFNLGTWTQLSLTPGATRTGLVLFAAYAMLFALLIQRLDSLEEIQRLLRWMAIAAMCMAALGLVQYFAGNGKFLWVYEHPSRVTSDAVKGPFVNENHFAHFLALGVGPLIWWIQQLASLRPTSSFSWSGGNRLGRYDEAGRLALGVGAAAVLLAGLLTFSRGGVLILALAIALCVGLLARRSLLSAKTWLALIAVVCVAGLALLIHGHQSLAGQLATIQDLPKAFGRSQIWAADIKAILDFPLLGTGVGSHCEVYPLYFDGSAAVEYTHAESGYLQIFLETGSTGGVLLLVALGWCGYWCVQSLRRARSSQHVACAAAVTSGLAISAIHSIWDFVWYIPACMTFTVFLAACACRLHQLAPVLSAQPQADLRLSWIARATVCIGVACVVGVMTVSQLFSAIAAVHWDRYLIASAKFSGSDSVTGLAVPTSHSGQTPDELAVLDQLAHDLSQTVRWRPAHARAHLRLASVLLRQFEAKQRSAANAMPLTAIRDAAHAASFQSREELDAWLAVAIGENRLLLDEALHHIDEALRLCPLQGEGYVYRAELGFLKGQSQVNQAELLQQALLVRPQSGIVLLAAGREEILSGNPAQGLAYWKRAFAQGPDVQVILIDALSPQVPAETLLTQFQPDLAATRLLFAHYSRTRPQAEGQEIGKYYSRRLEQYARSEPASSAVNLWHDAQGVYHFLGNRRRAADCAQEAVTLVPGDLQLRQACAARMIEDERFDCALEHLAFCQKRQPLDRRLAELIVDVKRRSLAAAANHAARDSTIHSANSK